MHDGADIVSGIAVNGDEGLDADLEVFGFVENAGVEGAGGGGGSAVLGGGGVEFEEGDHVFERFGKADIGDVLLEIGELVLKGEPPIEGVG